MHGLDEYDSEARWFYPAIVRTTTIDPLAEMYYSISPYAWCGNNPVSMVDPTGMSYDWVEREDKSVYFDPAAKNQATTKKNERYIGPTADLIDQNGNHHYGDQFGETWRSTSLAEVTITAEMPSHIRDIQAGITMGIYDSHKDFWNSEYTQGGIFMLSNLLGIGETVMALESIYSLGKLAWNGGKALISAAKGGLTNPQLVQKSATLAERAIGGQGPVAGIAKHKYATQLLDRYQSIYGHKGLFPNHSFNNGVGNRGILDVLDKTNGIIYDFKFGKAVMRPAQYNKYYNNFGLPIQIIRP